MYRKKNGNPKVAKAITDARGERSFRQYGEDTGVNYMTIYKIEKCDSLPSPDTIKRLTTGPAKPRNNITYEDVMIAAGYQIDYRKEKDQINYNQMSESAKVRRVAMYREASRFRSFSIGLIIQMLSGNESIKLNSINYPQYERGIGRPDLMISLDGGTVDEWWFEILNIGRIIPKHKGFFIGGPLGKIVMYPPNKNRKISFVVNDPDIYVEIRNMGGRISYRGDLSIILIDMDEGIIVEETYLSHYYEDGSDSEIFII